MAPQDPLSLATFTCQKLLNIYLNTSDTNLHKGRASTGNILLLFLKLPPGCPTAAAPFTHTADKSNYFIMKAVSLLLSVAAVASSSTAQEQYPNYEDYADGYEQDDLYQNYAMKQQEKAVGGG
jgi:hypothetical protein